MDIRSHVLLPHQEETHSLEVVWHMMETPRNATWMLPLPLFVMAEHRNETNAPELRNQHCPYHWDPEPAVSRSCDTDVGTLPRALGWKWWVVH